MVCHENPHIISCGVIQTHTQLFIFSLNFISFQCTFVRSILCYLIYIKFIGLVTWQVMLNCFISTIFNLMCHMSWLKTRCMWYISTSDSKIILHSIETCRVNSPVSRKLLAHYYSHMWCIFDIIMSWFVQLVYPLYLQVSCGIPYLYK